MLKQLKDGLLLRSLSEGHTSDRENLAQFYVDVFGTEYGEEEDTAAFPPWVADLTSGHVSTTLEDIWVVVDPAKDDKIVSAQLLIPQTWRYEEVEFGLGRVEIVATHQDYRRRGLIGALMDASHERSAQLGHVMQGITGIPYYYRRFGYAFAVELGSRSVLPMHAVPKLGKDDSPKYTCREATVDDIPNLVMWDREYARQCLLSVVCDEARWRYDLTGRSEGAPGRMYTHIVSTPEGEDVGYFSIRTSPTASFIHCMNYVIGEKSSYMDTFGDVTRAIKTFSETFYQDKTPEAPPFIRFDAGVSPTVDTLIDKTYTARTYQRAYAWYIRIPDLPRFVRLIAPVLERRLAGSGANRYTGDLKISFYDSTGLTLQFEDGKLTDVFRGELPVHKADAAYPYDYFINVMLGHLTAGEIRQVLTDGWAEGKAQALFEILFPKKRSWLNALA